MFLAAGLLALVLIAIGVGYLTGEDGVARALGKGAPLVVLHAATSALAGALTGWTLGPGAAVGGHLGLYNLATPLAVWLRVRWLRQNRLGFIGGEQNGAGWVPVFLLLWAVSLSLGLFLIRLLKVV